MEILRNILVISVLVINLKSFCNGENCDKYGVLFYEDIACTPIKTEGNTCPSKYDCSFSQPKSGCLFKGKTYGIREEIKSDLTYSACSTGCYCGEINSIKCAVLDCPEFFGHNRQPGCYNGYELGKCCSTGQICNSENGKKCEVDGKSYKLGQRFSPKNTCFSCVCHENFTGEYDEQTCIRRNCASQIRSSSQISQNCAPAYFAYNSDEVLCCPNHFVCPESSDTIKIVNSNADKDSNLECSYGEKKLKLGEGLRRNVNKYGKDRNLECECIIPPLLTCKEI